MAKANASVAAAAPRAQSDPLRPAFHLTAPAYWMNDPNAPVCFDGVYHLFYQHNPYGAKWANMSWGHAVSPDLVQWQHRPIALTPEPESCDKDGVFSGCCVIANGVPTIVYTGVAPQVQCLARSADRLLTWEKYAGNPVIAGPPPDLAVDCFRDPFVWREKDRWLMLVGAGVKGCGTALVYESADLIRWTYRHPLCGGFGKEWECPNFFPLANRHVLVVSPGGPVKYAVGDFQDLKFVNVSPWRLLDLGEEEPAFYATHTLADASGRRILWGWINGGGTPDYPWSGCLSLPRVLDLRPDGRLRQEPLPELEQLRREQFEIRDTVLAAESVNPLAELHGNCLEIQVEIKLQDAIAVGLEIGCSPDGREKHPITYCQVCRRLTSGRRGANFELLADESVLKLRVFYDRSVVEVFVNGRECLTSRYRPSVPGDQQGLRLVVRGGKAVIRSCRVWNLKSIGL